MVYVLPLMVFLKLGLIWWFFTWAQPLMGEAFKLAPSVTVIGFILVVAFVLGLLIRL